MTASIRYLSCVETAKLVRIALARAFPGVKFSVTSDTYAGGASIRVRYTRSEQGPDLRDVRAVAQDYEGGGFDGMIDMSYSIESWLMPDGSVGGHVIAGTQDSRGTVPSRYDPAPAGAELVSFGATYVFVEDEAA